MPCAKYGYLHSITHSTPKRFDMNACLPSQASLMTPTKKWEFILWVTLPETNSSHLIIGHPKRKLVFQPSIFRCDNVSFQRYIYLTLGSIDFWFFSSSSTPMDAPLRFDIKIIPSGAPSVLIPPSVSSPCIEPARTGCGHPMSVIFYD